MASDQIIMAGIAWVVVGIVVAVVAAMTQRPFFAWLLYCIAFWPLAVVHLIFWRPRIRDAGPLDEDES